MSAKVNVIKRNGNNAALPLPAYVRQLHVSGAVLTKSNDGGLYPGHIRTTPIQKAMLAVGSGVAALSNPYRHGTWHIFQECLVSLPKHLSKNHE